jgi:hypothetical protein
MASSNQDPESEKRKDKAFDRILAEALSSAAHKDCPDAETLAAFYEHSLAPAETAHWRAHFAGCSRCQQTLAAMAASDPNPLAADEVARLGELVAASAPPAAAPKSRVLNWPRFLDPRTLAPLAAAAVLAVALWATLHSPSPAPNEIAFQFPSVPPITEPPASESAPAPPSALAEPSAANSAAKKSSPATEQFAVSNPASAPPAPPPPAPRAMAQSAAPAQSDAAALDEAKETTPAELEQSAPPEQAQSASGSAAGSGGGVAAGASESTSAAAAPPAVNGLVGGTVEGRLSAAAPRKEKIVRARAVSADKSVATTNPQVLWRFGSAGSIEHSTDGGATWTPQSSPVQTDLLAGSAPSETVCWLVGRNGVIVRTIDGMHWELVPSPPQAEQNSQPPDWTFIDARDAQSATIGAADGRRFSTTDAGKSWQPQ